MIELYTALSIGLIGSFHCIGMCGPIAVSLPLGNRSVYGKFYGTLLYNTGRTMTYGVLGALFGLLGKGIEIAGFQQLASVAIGIVMIMSVIFPFIFKGNLNPERLISNYGGRLVSKFQSLFKKQSYSNLFTIGLLNGLLPCGLVYVALAGAVNTNEMISGILFMLVFGIGTIPVMLGVSMAGNFISTAMKRKINKIIPAFIIFLGVLFILRGLSLGIPYISPKSQMLTPDKEVVVQGACCD